MPKHTLKSVEFEPTIKIWLSESSRSLAQSKAFS